MLGGILLDQEAIYRVLEMLAPDGSDFYSTMHGKIFSGMASLIEKNTPIDIITVTDLLSNTDILDSKGGVSYLAELIDATPTAANITYHAHIIKEKALLRELIKVSRDITNNAYTEVEDVNEFLDNAEKSIFEVAEGRTSKTVFQIKDFIKDTFNTIEELYANKSHLTGVSTGFDELDKMTSGFQKSDLIIIAGRPSMGKTAFCLNLAENAAIEAKAPVALFSLEMSKEQLVQRLLASRAKVSLSKLRSGYLVESDWPKLTTAVGSLYEAPIFIDDSPSPTVLEIRAKARRWKAEFDIQMVIVDYLQLIKGRRGLDSREKEISEVSRSLKALAKELDIPVIALSQLSRRSEERDNKKPILSDLRESGAIEQDADIVMFVFREYVYSHVKCKKGECTCENQNDAEIIVAKQRNGPTGSAHLTFLGEFTLFTNQFIPKGDYGEEWAEREPEY